LDAESLAGAVAPVLAGRTSLLVCHRLLLGLGLLRGRLAGPLRLGLVGRIGLGAGLRGRLAGASGWLLGGLLLGGIGLVGLVGLCRGGRVGGLGLRPGLRPLAAGVDLVDPHAGQVLPVTVLATVRGLLLELEDDELGAQCLTE